MNNRSLKITYHNPQSGSARVNVSCQNIGEAQSRMAKQPVKDIRILWVDGFPVESNAPETKPPEEQEQYD